MAIVNEVLFINGIFMRAGNPKYINGTVLFQLTIQSNTTINVMHKFGPNIHQLNILNQNLRLIELEDVCNHRQWIRVQGFIKTNFSLIQRAEGSPSVCFGAIGADDFCLEVKIVQFDNPLTHTFEIGQNVEFQGFIRKSEDFPPQLIARTLGDIVVIDGVVKDVSYLCECVKSPVENVKKSRQD
ncbi:uncharacterized protein LOC107046036 [Diachasma alloeum]|uniref:uncharacterized protein LOC107046036 n=1 Tax=Diachasma alloeum TaxID=454923 RepID=UPI0007383FD2|nr:uncharacterized protein LOC107046036 [Diachasma alloeum]